MYFWGFTVFHRCFKSLNILSKISKVSEPKIQKQHFVFFKTPQKNFFRRPAAGDLAKPNKIPCRTGRRESYRVILVGRGRAAEGRPKKNFLGGLSDFVKKGFGILYYPFFQKYVYTKIHTNLHFEISEQSSKNRNGGGVGGGALRAPGGLRPPYPKQPCWTFAGCSSGSYPYFS